MTTPMTATITANMVCKVVGQHATNAGTPEGKLWLAVILDAIRTSSDSPGKQSSENRIHRAIAIRFFKTKWFEQICDFAGVSADATREAVAKIGTTVNLNIDYSRLTQEYEWEVV